MLAATAPREPAPMLAIAAPMPTELAGIRRAVPNPAARGIAWHITGVGRAPTVAGIAPIVVARPAALIMAGFCGAADPALRPGDLHIASAFHHAGRPDSIPADANLSARIAAAARQTGLSAVTAPSATVATVAGPRLKAAARRDTGAASVNMEDCWAAGLAADAGIPFAAVRAVLDTALEELPPYLAGPDNTPARLILGLASHPGRAPGLLRLARRAHIARRSLTQCLLAAITALASPAPEPAITAAPR